MKRQPWNQKEPIRVLQTNFLRGWGGQSNRVLQESVECQQRGCEILLSVPPDSELSRRAADAGLRVDTSVRYAGGLRWQVWADSRAFRKLVRDFRPHIIHLHGGRDSWCYVAARVFGGGAEMRAPVVVRSRHNIFPISDNPLNRWQYSRIFEWHLCVSEAARAQLLEKPYILRDRMAVINSAIDLSRLEHAEARRNEYRAELGLAPEHFAIMMVSRLRPEKGHEVLLKAAHRIVKRHDHARIVLVGSGSRGDELANAIRADGLGDHVIFAGFRAEGGAYFAAADLAVQPSFSEGLTTTGMEAGYLGKCMVASRVGGIPEVIKDGETGCLFEVGNSDDLANTINWCIEHSAERKLMEDAARIWIRSHFNTARLGEETMAFYKKVLTAPTVSAIN